MLTSDSITKISEIFIGDTEGYYSYKSGAVLVRFFNQYFGYKDQYGQGFPSRWAYTHDKLVDLFNNKRINNFFSLILSKSYLMKDLNCNEVTSLEQISKILDEFNKILKIDMCLLVGKNGDFKIINEDDDLIPVGSGGFADVFRVKSTGLILKKLRDEFAIDPGIRSRFKREYDITLSLQDLHGIIKVFNFDNGACSYTMEPAEMRFDDYINQGVSEDIRINCIRQILYIMKTVHDRGIIHRDISPNNIFIFSGLIKIADFGLGKDLNVLSSHQTLLTNQVGQFLYCAPEQFMLLRDGDKKSDVFSIGRLINFIMTGLPTSKNHFLRTVTEKATSDNSSFRYMDAGELLKNVEKSILFHKTNFNKIEMTNKMRQGIFSDEIENYVFELNGESLCLEIISNIESNYKNSLYQFMLKSENHELFIIQSIYDNYEKACTSFESNDSIATFVSNLITGKYSYVVKELSARILQCIAYDVHRFHAQHLIDSILSGGVEPLIEEILDSH